MMIESAPYLTSIVAIACLSSLVAPQDPTSTSTPVGTDQTNASRPKFNLTSSMVEFFGDSNDTISNNELNSTKTPKKFESKVEYKEKPKQNKFRVNTSDPLDTKAQSPNPFVSGRPRRPGGGIDPQLALMLQNNPRLRQLAEQNPEIAQQIYRNPRLLQNPLIQSAIRQQLGDDAPRGGGLLGLLPPALNPLGIGLGGGGPSRSQYGGGRGGNGGARGGNGGGRGGGFSGPQNEQGGGLFGAPRGANRGFNRNRPNEENIGGGYYGNNGNYNGQNGGGGGGRGTDQGQANQQANDVGNQQGGGEGGEGGEGQDYDNAGQDGEQGGEQGGEEGGEEGGEGQEAQDPSQDPANDPDIQQLQNLGGGTSDNFPESLFPPGLLSKEDIDEIRKQQEKQAREQAERERQQQGGGQPQGGEEAGNGGQGQDYDYGNADGNEGGEGGEGEGGEEGGEEGAGEEVTTEAGDDTTTENHNPVTTSAPVYRPNANPDLKYKPEFGGVRQGSVNNPGVEYDEVLDPNTPIVTPPTLNSVKPKGRPRVNVGRGPIPPAIPVPGVQYKGQVPVQPYVQPGLYQQPVPGQVYGQQPQFAQPIQYYPQYPQQYFIPQQYPQQFVGQQPVVPGQQPGQPQYIQQPVYQTVPVQPGYLPQPIYGQYIPNQTGRQSQQRRGRPALDPNLVNHNLNTIPTDDSDNAYDSPNTRLGSTGRNGRSFQQQPRIFSSSAQNTESSVAYNTTEPTVDSNKFNVNMNDTYDDIRRRTQPSEGSSALQLIRSLF